MSVLVLGGTKFLGRAFVEAALARGHELTLFNRGETNADLFPEVEKLRGDREKSLSALEGRSWDAVVDPPGYVPAVVRASAELLRGSGRYVFVSSISVYADFSERWDEAGPIAELGDAPAGELTPDFSNYGALKALCEAEVERAFGDRWVTDEFLQEHEVGEWMELPLWIAGSSVEVDVSRAVGDGLRFRPLAETIRGAAEAPAVEGVGLTPERETELLDAWRER